MRQLPTVALLGLLVTSGPALAQSISGPAPLPAPVRTTVTADELVHLRANGLGDDVLIALVESHGAVYQLAAADLLALRQRGLSDRVLTAMLRSGRPAPLSTEVVTPRGLAPMPVEVPAIADPRSPVGRRDDGGDGDRPEGPSTVVNVSQSVNNVVEQPQPYYTTYAVPLYVNRPDRNDRPRIEEPSREYWGFGGQRRPDSWAPPNDSRSSNRPDPKPEVKPEPRAESRPADAKDARPAARPGGRGGSS